LVTLIKRWIRDIYRDIPHIVKLAWVLLAIYGVYKIYSVYMENRTHNRTCPKVLIKSVGTCDDENFRCEVVYESGMTGVEPYPTRNNPSYYCAWFIEEQNSELSEQK